jgi:hypothetical protein
VSRSATDVIENVNTDAQTTLFLGRVGVPFTFAKDSPLNTTWSEQVVSITKKDGDEIKGVQGFITSVLS